MNINPDPDNVIPDGATYLTPEEVVKRWRGSVTVRTLANWRSLGIGPKYFKAGGPVLYPVAAVLAYERERTQSGTNQYKKGA